MNLRERLIHAIGVILGLIVLAIITIAVLSIIPDTQEECASYGECLSWWYP